MCENNGFPCKNRIDLTVLKWQKFKLERATGIEPAQRDGVPNGLENHRATITLRPRTTLNAYYLP